MSSSAHPLGTILLTGATGQVGGELLPLLEPYGQIVAPGRTEMDLSDPQSVRAMIRQLQPRWIVNPGAYTAVDKAESEPELAFAVNRDTVAAMGEEARTIGAAVISFSTDYVFAGTGTQPYRETDATGPQNVYGASKLGGEQALASSGAAHIILRTSWVYGTKGKNFLRTILKLAREREELSIVGDQYGAPTWSRDLARLTVTILQQSEATSAASGKPLAECVPSGIYHAADAGETTWHGFAQAAVDALAVREPETRFAKLHAIPTAQYPTPARRPANSRMDCSKITSAFGFSMPAWQQSLAAVLAELA